MDRERWPQGPRPRSVTVQRTGCKSGAHRGGRRGRASLACRRSGKGRSAGQSLGARGAQIRLKDGGAKKIQVIREIRSKEAKDLFEGAPTPVKEGVSKEEAVKLKKRLEDVGATVEIK